MSSPSDNLSRPDVHILHLDYACASKVMGRVLRALWSEESQSRIDKIVIKINLCEYRRPESGAVTDPVLLEALVNELLALTSEIPIIIAEADATSVDADSAFRYMSIDTVAARTGATLLNLSKVNWRKVAIPSGMHFKEMDVPNLMDDRTLYVNFAKLKINSGTAITGCLKNNYALIREKNKAQFHDVVHLAVHDVNIALASLNMQHINIIDGYVGVETMGGPAFGRPKRCELLIAGIDPVAVDSCEARVIGVRPRSVKHITYCAKSGLGSIRYNLQTDIPEFSYKKYKFQYERFQYWIRQRLKRRVGMGL